ncbi:MAG: protein kinase [Gemmatimonadota bacterium]
MTSPSPSITTALADRYRIERELGQGGMATVYLAEDLKHGRKVAIKILRPELSAEIGAERFLREIRTTARLQHPHIVPAFDSGEAEGRLFFVMPLIEGESLRARLDREGPLPVEDALRLIREIADALDYAHGLGILHRDLKPENIMLSRGHALLADFGIATVAGETGRERLTQTGTAIGTPAYMSPEQSTGERDLTPSSDVYSLGSILYELLTGEAPFTGPTFEAILVKRFTQDPPRCLSRRADTPPACDAAVAGALARDPDVRIQSARAFLDAIDSGSAPIVSIARPAADDRSIVVLPFVNGGADKDDEFFSDGLTEEIIADLSRVQALSVLSRTSSMRLKGTTKSVRALGQELRVRYALAGSVRRAGSSLRITAELIDTGTDKPVWAEKFSGTMDDVFDVQERVAREIVRALNITLTSAEDRQLADRPIADARAFEYYLQARQELRRYGVSSDHINALLERAIAIEGPTPPLRALRAYMLIAQVRAGMNTDLRPLDIAEVEARALMALAPDAPYGYALLGFIGYERGDLASTVRHLRMAIERDPNDTDAHFFLGIALIAAGKPEAAAEASRRFLAADPLSPFALLLACLPPWFVGRPGEKLSSMLKAVALDPDNPIMHWSLGYGYALMGRNAELAEEVAWMTRQVPLLPYTIQLSALLDGIEGRNAKALEALARVDSAPLDAHHTFHLCESFAMAGDARSALALFERAVDRGFYPHEFFAEHDRFLAPLKGMPEFERILAKAARRVAEFSA